MHDFIKKDRDIIFSVHINILSPGYQSPISSILIPQAKLTLLILNTYVIHYLFTLYFVFLLNTLSNKNVENRTPLIFSVFVSLGILH